MKISKYKISTTDIDKLVNYLAEELSFDYENSNDDMCLLVSEEFYFRNNSTQVNMVIVKRDDYSLYVDVIGGGGGTGLFNISLWSEKGYIKRVSKVLNKFIEEFGLTLEELLK